MAQKAYIDIIDIDTQTLLDSKRNDIAFYTLFGDQKILMSAGSNVASKLCITSNNIGIGTVNPRVKLDIQSTDALQIPAGTSIDRSNFSTNWNNGQIRYNTNIQQFEGYANNNWALIGGTVSGVTDNNNDTYISAETSPGINNDQLQFYTSNINRMIIDKNGYVGIGTTIPGEKLHIYSSNAKIRLQDTISSNNITTLDFYNSSNINGYIGYLGTSNLRIANTLVNGSIKIYTSNAEQIAFDNTGNIGINTMTPGEKLHIYSSNARIRLQDTISSNNITTLDFYNSSNINGYIGYVGTSNLRIANTLPSGSVKIYTSNAEQIIFDSTGNIGINTMNPGEKLHITASNAKIRIQDIQSNNITSKVDFYNSSNLNGYIGYFGSQDLLLNNSASNGALRLYTSNTEKLTILNSGFVGIGNNAPNAKLEINHNTTSPALLITNGDTSLGFTNQSQISFGFAGTNQYNHFIHTRHNTVVANNAIDFYLCNGTANNTLTTGSTFVMTMNAGNVGIGTTNPSYPLDVVGAGNISGILRVGVIGGTTGGTIYLASCVGDAVDAYAGIQVRQYAAPESTELLLWQLNDTTNGAGPDRIRMYAANICFDTYSSPVGTGSQLTANTKMILTETGNLGIGTLSPATLLHVEGGTLSFGSTTRQMITLWGSGTGSYGIGVQNSTTYFRSGAGNFSWFAGGIHNDGQNNAGGGVNMMLLDANANLTIAGANATKASGTTWINPSDIRIKTDVTVADYDRCYEIMSNLDLKRYKYRDDLEKFNTSNMNDKTRLGWIANEVELYYPKAIIESDKYGISNLKSLDVDQIYACMYGTIKKIIKENEELKVNVNKITNDNEELKNNVNEMNNKINFLYSKYSSNM